MQLLEEYPEHSILIKLGDQCIWAWTVFQLAKKYCSNETLLEWCGLDTCLVFILKDYYLLQIAKMHDPATSCGHENHSIEKIISTYGANNDQIIIKFHEDNKEFIEAARDARNKTIAHSDLETTINSIPRGAYLDGTDDKYFLELHDVVNYLYTKAGIGSFPEWPTFIDTDFDEFLSIINKGSM